jgi:hypothetical protein
MMAQHVQDDGSDCALLNGLYLVEFACRETDLFQSLAKHQTSRIVQLVGQSFPKVVRFFPHKRVTYLVFISLFCESIQLR